MDPRNLSVDEIYFLMSGRQRDIIEVGFPPKCLGGADLIRIGELAINGRCFRPQGEQLCAKRIVYCALVELSDLQGKLE
jgi:hypothetical protein